MRFGFIPLFLIFQPFFWASVSHGLEKPGENLKEVGLSTELGRVLDLSLEFKNENAEVHPLRSYLKSDKPNIIIPAYYDCPRLCGLLLEGVKELLPKLKLSLGDDYRVVTISFNPLDTPESAREVRAKFADSLTAEIGDRSEWLFLSGTQENIVPLMKQLGFHYKEDKGEFAHTAAIFVATPAGTISQYFGGISFPFRDVRLSLVEAGEGQIGTVLDQVLLYCFRFDPSEGKYTWAAFSVMRAGGGLTFLFLAGLILYLRRREKSSLAEKNRESRT